jgi:tetratricopeptide (TPR) repeat protein
VLERVVEVMTRSQERSGSAPLIDQGIDAAEKTRDAVSKWSTVEIAQDLAKLQLMNKQPDSAAQAFGPDFLTSQIRSWAGALVTYAEFWAQQKTNRPEVERAVHLALKVCPDDPVLCRRLANIYMRPPAREDAALDVYGPGILKSIQDSPADLYAYFSFWIGWKSNVASAMEAQKSLLRLRPDSLYYRSYAAAVLWRGGYRDRALAVFGPDYVAAHPDRMSHLFEYGLFWAQRGANLKSAIPALVRAAKLSPRTASEQRGAATALVEANRADLVPEIFGPAYLSSIADDADSLIVYAEFWLERKQNQASALAAMDMMSRLPKIDWFHRSRGAYCLGRNGFPDRAEKLYGADYLQGILSGDAMPLIRFAEYWKFQNKNLEWALKAARAACRAEPQSAEAWSILAETLVAQGQLADALGAMEKAVKFERNSDQREKYQKRCAEIRNSLSKK